MEQSEDEDDWDVEHELPLIAPAEGKEDNVQSEEEDDDEGWETKLPPPKEPTCPEEPTKNDDRPMLLVDLTMIDPTIHSRFDKNSVNDPEAASRLRKNLSLDELRSNAEYLANGAIVSTGSGVWKAALQRMRDERPGHYFVPVFP